MKKKTMKPVNCLVEFANLPLSSSSNQDRGHAAIVRDDVRDDHDDHCDETNVPKDLSAVALQLCWTLVKLRPFDH